MRDALSLFGNIRVRNGKSAYELALLNGFVGTVTEWLASLEGADGAPGTPGTPGEDGVSTYTYVAYASDNTGTGFSLTSTDLLKYRAEIHSTTALTPVEADFWGADWVKFLGDDGSGGGSVTQVTGLTLVVANWVADGALFKYVLSDASITATSSVEVIPDNASYDVLVVAEPRPRTESASGTVTMWVKNVPTADIPVTINITEVV